MMFTLDDLQFSNAIVIFVSLEVFFCLGKQECYTTQTNPHNT